MEAIHLNDTVKKLLGPTSEQVTVWNQWAAYALNKYHNCGRAVFEFDLNGAKQSKTIIWDSKFSKAAMREHRKLAENGAVYRMRV